MEEAIGNHRERGLGVSTPAASGGNPFRAILDVGAALVSSLELEEVFANVAQKIGEAMMAWSVDIQTYDRERGTLLYEAFWCQGGATEADSAYLGTVIDIRTRPDWLRVVEGRDVVEWHIDDPDLPAVEREGMKAWGYKTTLDAPLMVGDQVIGILGLSETRFVRKFTSIEIDLFKQLCGLAAVAISNAQVYRRQQEQTRHLDALLDASRAITSSVVLDEVLAKVAEKAALALATSECVIHEYDPEVDALIWRAMFPMTDYEEMEDRVGTVYPLSENPSDRAILEGKRLLVESLSDADLKDDARTSMEEWGEKTCLNVPLMFEDEPLGIMVLIETESERRFAEDELELARALGEQAAVAIRNAKAYEDQQGEAQRTRALLEAGRAITSSVDVDEVLAVIVNRASRALGVSAAALYEYDASSDTFGYRALFEEVTSLGPDDDMGTWYPLAQHPGERAIIENEGITLEYLSDPDLPADRRRNMEQWNEHTCLNVPLRVGEERLGVLRFYDYETERFFSTAELELASGLAEQAAIAYHNARLYEDVRRQRSRLSSLLDASRALTSTLVPKEVFDAIVRRSAEAFGAPRCALYEYDPMTETLSARAFFEPEPTPGYYVLDVPEPIARRPADKVILDGGQVVVESIGDQSLHPATRAEMEFWGESTVLNVPLYFVGAPLGLLMVIFTGEERAFSENDLALASGMGEQAAIAIYNARLHDSVDRERRRSVALFGASRMLTSTLVRDEVMALVTQRAAETLRSPRCDLYEFDATTDTLTLRGYFEEVASGLYANVGEPEPLDERPGDRLILEQGEVVVQSLSDQGLDPATRAEMDAWGEKTCMNVPLIVKGEPLGILIITETERERRFGDDEIEVARAFGEQVGMALQNTRLYGRLETQNQRLLNLLQSSRVMTGAMDVEKTVATMCSEMANLLDCPVCHIDVGLRREGGEFLPPEVFAADGEEVAANLEPAMVPDELTERALSARQPQQSDDDESGSRLVIPLLAKDVPSGFVELSGPLRARFGEDELEVVQILANQAATAIDNARMYQDQERQAITDGLTGLYNHRFFYDRLRSEMARSLRYFTPLSLLILDVDDFKRFNDTYGHVAGDEALREIGRLLQQGVRQHIDIPCRYGGEEFAVILPNTAAPGALAAGERLQGEFARVAAGGGTGDGDAPAPTSADDAQPPALAEGDGEAPLPAPNPDGAVVVGERIRATVESARFHDEVGSPLRGVTVSVGVAAFPDHGVSGDALVAAADKALYLAKSRGKNRVEIGDPTV
jgi:GAF domain-containing protein